MIEPTDEMVAAYCAAAKARYEQHPSTPDEEIRAGLAAVLAIVERDVVPEAYGMGRDDEANYEPMAVTLDEINARRGRSW